MSIYAAGILVHDTILFSYSRFAREKENRFHTASLDDKSHEYLGVIFSGVFAYHSKHNGFWDGRK